jgi:hypothetical protein
MLRVILFSAAYLVYSKGSRGITDVCTWHIHRSQRPPTYTRTCHIMHLLSMHASRLSTACFLRSYKPAGSPKACRTANEGPVRI